MTWHIAPRADDVSSPESRAALLDVIRQTWAAVLGAEDIGPDDDFLAIGGTSLGLATAAALLGERFGIDVPLRMVLTATTPAMLASRLAALRVESAGAGTTPFFPAWVVPLQPEGGGTPVFVFPGGSGDRVVLAKDAQIAVMAGRGHPFFGFSREVLHVAPDRADWVAATAAAYVAQMRCIQDRGPYLLYAICSGAPFAWEAASQLVAAGDEIAGMLFYEAPLEDVPEDLGRPRYTPERPLPGRAPWYVPESLDVDLTLLMTEDWQAKRASDGWLRVAHGRIETIVMPGGTPGVHGLYVRREAMIAEHVRDWLARTEARWAAR